MAILFGLDMSEFAWYKFGSKYMFGNTDYYLRRTKFAVYQGAMIFCVVSESLGTSVLSDYVDSQNYIEDRNPNAVEHNDSYIGMASYNIFAGIFVAFVFGAAFFFDLLWPARHEDKGIRLAWKGCAVTACVFMLASAICEVVIVTTHNAYITGVSREEADRLFRDSDGYDLLYQHNGRAIASVVFAWLGLACVIASTVIMWMSINHTEKYGPFSSHVRNAEYHIRNQTSLTTSGNTQEKSDVQPNNVHGNHYEAPGYHVEGLGHQHEDPTSMQQPAVLPTATTRDHTMRSTTRTSDYGIYAPGYQVDDLNHLHEDPASIQQPAPPQAAATRDHTMRTTMRDSSGSGV